MKKQILSILSVLLLAQGALANTEGKAGDPVPMPLVQPTPVVQKAAPLFQNERFSHPGLEKAYRGELTIQLGAEGEAVKRVQTALIDLGFGLPAGADGEFGGQTQDALMAFQSSRGIKTSGKIDQATLRSLDKVAPSKGMKVWQDAASAATAVPAQPVVSGKKVRVLVDLSEHRLAVYNEGGQVERVFPVASGAWGTPTDTGVKVVYDRVADPSPIAWALWPESRGGAFGTRMMDLNWYNPETGASWGSGEELHGTYVRNSIGSYASHGCVRMQNEDIEWVYNNVRVGDIVLIQQ
ncbi:MAG: murein L,D-transpeptidase [Candidatus Eremiobacteraeota bacterium]|nr:murein L,D-transpeptidase [Candidatus Eremiobacteraeota bacterium]